MAGTIGQQVDLDRHKTFPGVALLLGMVSVFSALAIGVVAYIYSVKMAEVSYKDTLLTKARMLGIQTSVHHDITDVELIRIIDVIWGEIAENASDEYLSIVDTEGRIIFHTKDPDLLDKNVGMDVFVSLKGHSDRLMVQQVLLKEEFRGVGEYVPEIGERETVAAVTVQERSWVLMVHRSKSGLRRSIRADLLGVTVAFVLVCGLLMPLSLSLLYCTFWLTHRKRTKAETGLRESNVQLSDSLQRLKKAQEQMIQQERMKAMGQMASGIAHDFSNSLMLLIGLTELMLEEKSILDDRDATVEMLESMAVAASDAKAVVGRLREFYSPDDDLKYATLDINHIVQSAVLLTQASWQAQAQAEGRSVSLKSCLEKIPSVLGSEFQIREALINLIFNALDAMPAGGAIHIGTQCVDGNAMITINDTGKGMDKVTLQRCFEAFYTTKGEDGTGMGLRMVHDIVERHNGSIDVTSEPEMGTTFTITLPAGSKAVEDTIKEDAADRLGPMNILIADDNVGSQETLKRYLIIDEHVVDVASTGAEAIQFLKDGTYDLVITDRAMPDMNGDMVAVAAKSKSQPVAVIMLTGFGDLMLEKKEYPPGVDMIIPKPVGYKQLRFAMFQVLLKTI